MTKTEQESPSKNLKTDLDEILIKYFELTEKEIELLSPSIVQIMKSLVTMVSSERKSLENELNRWSDEGGA